VSWEPPFLPPPGPNVDDDPEYAKPVRVWEAKPNSPRSARDMPCIMRFRPSRVTEYEPRRVAEGLTPAEVSDATLACRTCDAGIERRRARARAPGLDRDGVGAALAFVSASPAVLRRVNGDDASSSTIGVATKPNCSGGSASCGSCQPCLERPLWVGGMNRQRYHSRV